MNLYSLNQMYEEALEGALDQETGEIRNDILAELMGEVQEAKEIKVLNIACFVKNLNAEADALEVEFKKLKERRDRANKKAESLERYLESNIDAGEKFKNSKAEITWRKSSVVSVNCDVEDLAVGYPDLVRVKVTQEPNKTEIKKRIESGDLVLGCEILEKQNMVIK